MPGGHDNAETDRAIVDPVQWNRRTTMILTAIFVVVACIVLFYNLGDSRTLGSHEGYATVPAREMMKSGDWTVPYFGGIPRLNKPPLVYWILATLGTAYGELNEWLVRLPAAICALLLAILMGRWATKWYGKTAGWAAAFVQLTSLYILTYSRKAEIDMLVWLGIATALYLISNQPEAESRGRNFLRWSALFAIVSVCWLGKFHYGPAMIVAPLGVYFLIQKRWKSLLNFLNPLGLAMLAAAIIIWPMLVMQQLPLAWEIWQHETVGRATGALGYRPIWYYIPTVLWLTLPWTPFCIGAIPASWRRAWKQKDTREQFLWIWFLTHFVIVTLQPSKHVHYIIAGLPVATMLAGQRLATIVERMRKGQHHLSRNQAIMLTIIAMVGPVVGVVIATRFWPMPVGPVSAVGCAIGCGACAVVWLARFRRLGGAGIAFVSAFLIGFVIVHSGLLRQRDHRLGSAEFAQHVRSQLGEDTPVIAYKLGQSPVVFYLDTPVARLETRQNLKQRIQRDGRVFLMAMKPDTHQLSTLGEVRIIDAMPHRDEVPDPKHPLLVLVEIQSGQYASAPKQEAETALR